MKRKPLRLKPGTRIVISSWVDGWLAQQKEGVVKYITVLNGKFEKKSLLVVSVKDQEYFTLEEVTE